MPPIPKPHGLYLQLPSHHRAPIYTDNDINSSNLAGLPYATIAAYNKSISVWKLIHSLEITTGLYCEEMDVDEEGGDDSDDEEEDREPKTMVCCLLLIDLMLAYHDSNASLCITRLLAVAVTSKGMCTATHPAKCNVCTQT